MKSQEKFDKLENEEYNNYEQIYLSYFSKWTKTKKANPPAKKGFSQDLPFLPEKIWRNFWKWLPSFLFLCSLFLEHVAFGYFLIKIPYTTIMKGKEISILSKILSDSEFIKNLRSLTKIEYHLKIHQKKSKKFVKCEKEKNLWINLVYDEYFFLKTKKSRG